MDVELSDLSLRNNPFFVLGASTRDSRHRIVELAEERSLHADGDICQNARATLVNLKRRLSTELAWFPGVAPAEVARVLSDIVERPLEIFTESRLPALAKANAMLEAFACLDEDARAGVVSTLLLTFARTLEAIDAQTVLHEINEDRRIAGFIEVNNQEFVLEELNARRKHYRSTVMAMLEKLKTLEMVGAISIAVRQSTGDGKRHAPLFVEDLVNGYEIGAERFLDNESQNVSALIERCKNAVNYGTPAIASTLELLETVTRNWYRIAEPIMICANAAGTRYVPGHDVANSLRGLGLSLNNDHQKPDLAHRVTKFLQSLFVSLPELQERLSEDARVLSGNKVARAIT